MSTPILITGGTLLLESGPTVGNLLFDESGILACGKTAPAEHAQAQLIEADGQLVMPGVLDVHTHLDLEVAGTRTADDFSSGTRSALHGGVTTLIDFATPPAHGSLSQGFDKWYSKSEDKCWCDVGFHMCITDWKKQQSEIPQMLREGVSSFKEYMIYDIRTSLDSIHQTLKHFADCGAQLLVHAEDPAILEPSIAKYHTHEQMEQYGAWLHAVSRPTQVESNAIQTLLGFNKESGGALYIVHLSTGEGAELIRKAKAAGQRVNTETCPHYLLFTDQVFKRKNGHYYATCPQIKSAGDQERLWQGLKQGEISIVSTDTCSFTPRQKNMWHNDFTKIPMGLPGLEILLPSVYTKGVLEKRITLDRMRQVLCENPARSMGLYPRKGTLKVGADADILIVDPKLRTEVRATVMESAALWSPCEGMDLAGFPHTVFLGGTQVVRKGRICTTRAQGKYLKRNLPMELI